MKRGGGEGDCGGLMKKNIEEEAEEEDWDEEWTRRRRRKREYEQANGEAHQ